MIKLRKVSQKDCRLIWKWANDPEVRAESFTSKAIPYSDHVIWYERKINDPHCHLYIAENSDRKPVGQVRLEIEGNDAVISISLDRKFRGKGYGTKIIALASQKIFEISGVNFIHAYTKKGNIPSKSAFQKAGFIFLENTVINDQHAAHFILEKKNS
jgi:RimJ/RimL family protein N-acetyltransferase